MIVIIDNYDSFTYNLYQQVKKLTSSFEVRVFRNDEVSYIDVLEYNPKAIIISPGPGNPTATGICDALISNFVGPILGVCLGHQLIGQHFGAEIVRAPQPTHGKTSIINCSKVGLFWNAPDQIRVARYHSLIINPIKLPSCLGVTAEIDKIPMAIQHRTLPIFGVQFHPESFLTDWGDHLMNNFLNYVEDYSKTYNK